MLSLQVQGPKFNVQNTHKNAGHRGTCLGNLWWEDPRGLLASQYSSINKLKNYERLPPKGGGWCPWGWYLKLSTSLRTCTHPLCIRAPVHTSHTNTSSKTNEQQAQEDGYPSWRRQWVGFPSGFGPVIWSLHRLTRWCPLTHHSHWWAWILLNLLIPMLISLETHSQAHIATRFYYPCGHLHSSKAKTSNNFWGFWVKPSAGCQWLEPYRRVSSGSHWG